MGERAFRNYRLVLRDTYLKGVKMTAIEYEDSDDRIVGECTVERKAIFLAKELEGELLALETWNEELQGWDPIVFTVV